MGYRREIEAAVMKYCTRCFCYHTMSYKGKFEFDKRAASFLKDYTFNK